MPESNIHINPTSDALLGIIITKAVFLLTAKRALFGRFAIY
jgi:hypothetical protein|tara:strand:- start:359 stop:481 length:123 start_codon:yes stop_codon:yes gene_type:complete